MTQTTIQKGAVGADFVTTTEKILDWLKTNDCSFVVRYIARSSEIGKIVTAEEIDRLHTNGFAVSLIYEGTHGDALLGAETGTSNGKFAVDFARALGYPEGCVLSAAADTDIKATNIEPAIAYMNAFRKEVEAAGYQFGMYADEDLGKAIESQLLCIPGAAFWSRNLFQRIKAKMPFGLTVHLLQKGIPEAHVDRLTCFQTFPAWLPTDEERTFLGLTKHRVLRFWMRGEDVKAVQRALGLKTVTGFFFVRTRSAVKKFQTEHGITPTGVVGPQTWKALDEAAHV